MTHEEVQQQLDAYALGALDDVSARRIDTHLSDGCRDCADELHAWKQTTNMLAYAVNPVSPSPSVKTQLLSRINNSKPSAQNLAKPAHTVATSTRTDWRGWAVAAVLLIAFGVVFVYSMVQSRRVAEIEATNLKDRTKLQRQNAALALLEARDARITALSPAKDDVTSAATIIWSPSQKQWTMITQRMANAPTNKSYQLWFIVNDRKISGGVFNSPDEIAQQGLPPEITSADVIAITLEKSGGSPQPEGPILLAGKTS
jgi:anti-sigma-K factor RskA